jgi:uncharacterized protein
MANCGFTHAHRGGLGSTAPPAGVTADAFGGRPGLERLVDVFYDRVGADAELAPIFRNHADQPHARRRLVAFFMDWLGADPAYHREMRGGQQRIHYRTVITTRGASLWLSHFQASMRECGVAPATVKSVMKAIGPIARGLVNMDGETRHRPDPCNNANYIRRIWALAAKGDQEALNARIQDEPTLVQRRGEGGRTLLWEAAKNGRREMTQWLLDLGADVNAPGVGKPGYGKTTPPETLLSMTPHCVAALRKKADIAAALLAAGAVVDIYTCAMLGDIDALETMLEDATLVNAQDPSEDFSPATPLYHAVCGKQAAAVDLLLDRGADVEQHSVQLLTLAARRNALPIAKTLLARGATARDCSDLLYGVVDAGAGEWATLLIEHGADASDIGVRGRAMVEFPDVAAMALDRGATPTGLIPTCNGNNGNKGDHPEYAQALLDSGAEPNAQDGGGRTAICTAAKSGFPEYVDILLRYGADPNIADDSGRTPLSRAMDNKHWDIAVSLLEAGAQVSDAPLNKRGDTPLHRAAGAGHAGLVRALLAAGCDPLAGAGAGATPETYARNGGHEAAAEVLHDAAHQTASA